MTITNKLTEVDSEIDESEMNIFIHGDRLPGGLLSVRRLYICQVRGVVGLANSLVGVTNLTFSKVSSGLETIFDGAGDTAGHLWWVNCHRGITEIKVLFLILFIWNF